MKSKKYQLGCFIVACFFLITSAWGIPPKINGKYYLSQWSSPSFTNALADLNPLVSSSVLVIDQNITLTSSPSVNKQVALEFISGNIITTGIYTLTINGPVSAGLYQIFQGTAIFGNTGAVAEVYPQWWGAKVDGATDDTAAINAAFTSLPRTSPPGNSGWGLGTVRLTKGKWLVNGEISNASCAIGARFVGDGEYATSIIRTVDSGNLFKFYTYISVEIADMAIIHSTASGRDTWSNIAFSLKGDGGGRTFRLTHVTTDGFNTCIKDNGLVNGDTTYAEHCTFKNCTIFLDSLNTQAGCNTFVNCTWGGAISYGFYVASAGHTKILSGNVVIDGSFIYFRNIANKYGPASIWLLENVKEEWTQAHAVTNSAAKFIDGEAGNYIEYHIRLIGCGLCGGVTPAPGSLWARFNAARMQVDVVNCSFEGIVETTTQTAYSQGRNCYLKFTGSELTSPDTWSYNDTLVSGSVFPNMSFEDCGTALNTPITNITIAQKGIPYIHPTRRSTLSTASNAYLIIGYSGDVAQHGMPSYGQNIQIERVRVYLTRRNNGTTARTVNVYSNATRTNLVGSVVIPSGYSNVPEVYEVQLNTPPPFSTEGIYTSVDLTTAGSLYGYYVVEYSSR